MKNPGITRRELITGAVGAAAASGISACFPDVGGKWPDAGPDVPPGAACRCDPPGTIDANSSVDDTGQNTPVAGSSKVVTIQRDDGLDEKLKPRLDVVQEMVDSILFALSGGAENPWSVLLPDADKCARIGLKVNCLASLTPTSPVLVHAIVTNLVKKGGFCAGNIVIWERYLKEILDPQKKNKYGSSVDFGAQTRWTLEKGEDDKGPPLQGTGAGYMSEPWGQVEASAPRLSRVLSDETDFTINLPVLKGHKESGFTAALKNCYGMFDIPLDYHKQALQTGLPKLYAIPQIRRSIKLTIMDALRASVEDNTNPPTCSPRRIAASLDPLALDYYALDLINELRTRPKPPGSPIKAVDGGLLAWMENAYTLGLGAKSYTLVTPGADGDVPVDGGIVDAAG